MGGREQCFVAVLAAPFETCKRYARLQSVVEVGPARGYDLDYARVRAQDQSQDGDQQTCSCEEIAQPC